jgi:hypothetical protein
MWFRILRKGKIVTTHLILFPLLCRGQAWRRAYRRWVRESPAMADWRDPALSMGEKGSTPSSPPPHFLLFPLPKTCPVPLLRTLAADDNFLEILVDSGHLFRHQLPGRARLVLLYIVGP